MAKAPGYILVIRPPPSMPVEEEGDSRAGNMRHKEGNVSGCTNVLHLDDGSSSKRQSKGACTRSPLTSNASCGEEVRNLPFARSAASLHEVSIVILQTRCSRICI